MTTTIAAIASAPGPGLRGVIRLSGPATAGLLERTTAWTPPAERSSARVRFDDGRGEQPALVLWMPGPRSYTREDVAELHLPGAPPLLQAALARLLELGARAAQPGEFTRRAFENGRLDLTQAEGVLELVGAAGDAERRAALALLAGGLTERLAGLRDDLEELRALCEASLDFDEADTGHVPLAELTERVRAIDGRLEQALLWEVRRASPTGLPRVVLVGAPNAGKSSLFNALVPEGRALVSDLAGSTRDGVSGLWRVGGRDLLLLDAPGVEEGAGEADARAQELAARERAGADLLLHVVDARRVAATGTEEPDGAPCLRVLSQIDRLAPDAVPAGDAGAVAVSARTGAGLGELGARALALLGGPAAGGRGEVRGDAGGGDARGLGVRHRGALEAAHAELRRAAALLAGGAPLDLAAEALRGATDALDGIEGRTTPEDLLDRIFARFCLGK